MDVYPSLTYRDVRAAAEWLANAFGLEPRNMELSNADEIPHAELVYGQGVVLVQEERPAELHGSHAGKGWIYVTVNDVDNHYERAKAAGAPVLNEPHGSAANGGMRGYSTRDLEGNLWTFGTVRPQP
jgi:uncharacterized glyoxalase superfamily protein PhnB